MTSNSAVSTPDPELLQPILRDLDRQGLLEVVANVNLVTFQHVVEVDVGVGGKFDCLWSVDVVVSSRRLRSRADSSIQPSPN
jgi:hypothetical protein